MSRSRRPTVPMRLYEARPPGDDRGAIVVIQEAFGVNPHIEDVTRRGRGGGLPRGRARPLPPVGPGLGRRVRQLREGDGVLQGRGERRRRPHRRRRRARPSARRRPRRHAGSASSASASAAACRSWSRCAGALGAAVGFYGGGIVTGRFPQFPPLVDEVPSLQTPWLGLFGDQDASIPVDDVEQLRVALREAKVDTEIVRYADAGHGFHCDRRSDYRADDAADAWRRALDWFASHLESAAHGSWQRLRRLRRMAPSARLRAALAAIDDANRADPTIVTVARTHRAQGDRPRRSRHRMGAAPPARRRRRAAARRARTSLPPLDGAARELPGRPRRLPALAQGPARATRGRARRPARRRGLRRRRRSSAYRRSSARTASPAPASTTTCRCSRTRCVSCSSRRSSSRSRPGSIPRSCRA